jgi:hypothetical protein
MDKNSHQWAGRIDRHVPALLRGLARDFAGVQALTFYDEMRREGLSYRMHCFAKDEAASRLERVGLPARAALTT